MTKTKNTIVSNVSQKTDQVLSRLSNPIALAGRFQGSWNHGDDDGCGSMCA
jgi:hypothetical protein